MAPPSQRIIQLDKKTVNKIAAGEVVERPASVVKELVENAIDAQATAITVIIKDYGLEEIRVIDNGCGMSKEDALLSWKPHTTSKLKTIDDLDALLSLGFRGEALASIASVSIMEILTRQGAKETGTFLRIKGGTLEKVEERESAPGTIVSVKNLFFNVPARKKFLKSNTTELGHIIEVVTRQALIHPEIHFKLQHEATILLNCPKSDSFLEPFIEVFGVEQAKQMLPVEYQQEGLRITGLTSLPALSRSSRDFEFFYVNKRHVRSRLLSEAVEEAYKTLLMKHRYPVVLLNLTIEPAKIDVNIHPTKREVRFDDAKIIFGHVSKAITNALTSKHLWREAKEPLLSQKDLTLFLPKETTPSFSSIETNQSKLSLKKSQNASEAVPQEPSSAVATAVSSNAELVFQNFSSQEPQLTSFSSIITFSESFWLKPLGQVLNLYALCEAKDGIAIVDIHAAHERIRYEELLHRYQQSRIEQQELLRPLTFSLNSEQIAFLKEYLEDFKTIGLFPEEFGGTTYILRSLPVIMDISQTEEDITDLIDAVRSEIPKLSTVNERIDLLIKTMACHSVVRGGDSLSLQKIIAILKQLSKCKKPFTCPHGRPTIITISAKALEKEFGRIV